MVTKSKAKADHRKLRVAAGEISGVRPLVASFLVPWRSLSMLLRQGWRGRPHVDRPVTGGGYSALSPEARFESEAARERLTDRQVIALAIRTTRGAVLASVFFLTMFIYSVIHSTQVFRAPPGPLSPFFTLSYVWIFTAVMGMFALREHLRAYQFRSRRLVNLWEWIGCLRRKQLLRITDETRNRHPPLVLMLLFLGGAAAASLLFSHPALAQATTRGPVDVGQASAQMQNAFGMLRRLGPTDLSGQWLARLFPSLTGAQPGMLASMFSSFNTILLNLGGVFVFWQMGLGMVHAAQNGSLRGSRIHVPYSPMRTFAGAAALAPVLGGYCLAQALALQILGTGYWMADQLYSKMIGAAFSPAEISQSVNSLPLAGMSTLLNNGLSAETCFAWYQANARDLSIVGVPSRVGPMAAHVPTTQSVSTGVTPGGGLPWASSPNEFGSDYIYNLGQCGSLSVPIEGGATSIAVIGPRTFTGGDAFDSARNAAFNTYMSSLWSSGLPTALAGMISPNGGAAITAPAIGSPTAQVLQTDYAKSETAAATYLASTRTAAAALANSSLTAYARALKSTSQSLGWVSAGSLYSAISQMYTHAIGAATSSVPALTVTTLDGVSPSERAHIEASYNSVNVLMLSAILPISATYPSSSGGVIAPTGGTSFNAETASQRVLDQPSAALLFRIDHGMLLDPRNPIGSITSEGTMLIYSGGAMAGLGLAGSWALHLAAPLGRAALPVTPLARLGGKVSDIATILGEVLIIVGSFETYVVPMLFYITWMFAIVNVIAFAAEFVLAAPLAAFQHMRIFGEEAINQEQRQFYLISFLHGLLRPSFLLFGLAISTYVFSAISQVLNATFNLAAASSLGGSIVGPIGIVTFVLMLVFIQYQLSVRSIAMITRAPDAVADLVGGYLARLGGGNEGVGLGESTYGAQGRVAGQAIKAVLPGKIPGGGAGGNTPRGG